MGWGVEGMGFGGRGRGVLGFGDQFWHTDNRKEEVKKIVERGEEEDENGACTSECTY